MRAVLGQHRVNGKVTGRRQTGGGLGGRRRRSRAKYGDSSALLEAETADDIGFLAVPVNTISTLNCDKPEQFKFPRHKKTVVEAEADDDVSKQYLREADLFLALPTISSGVQRQARIRTPFSLKRRIQRRKVRPVT